jgi:hypothetical protein
MYIHLLDGIDNLNAFYWDGQAAAASLFFINPVLIHKKSGLKDAILFIELYTGGSHAGC